MTSWYNLKEIVISQPNNSRFPAGENDFCMLHSVQTGSEAHTASYPMEIFPRR
jgi:hypothetical protein